MSTINFKDIEVNELFLFSGRHFQKKDEKTAYMLPAREVKTFYEYMPVQPEDNDDSNKERVSMN